MKFTGLLWQQGVLPYTEGLKIQQSLARQRHDDPNLADVLLLQQHPPIYTLGRGSSLDFLKFDFEQSPAEIHRIGRGGEVRF